jgi:iron complex outermembrane receptor protein
MLRNQKTLSLAICAACAMSPAVHAQSADAVADGLGEIVVTAQRREQKMQDVPIAVQVITTDMLTQHVSEDMAQLDKWIPGLVVSGDSPTQPHYQLRGIGASDFGVGTDPAVGVYIDGVYAARSGASFLAFNDVERIEVLKGPQGTLLGRSSAAGAISVVTRKPSDVLEGSADVRLGSEGKQRYEGMLNLPLAAGMALRFNALSNQSDGFLRDAATGQKLNPEKNWAARAAFRWDIAPGSKLLVSWNHDSVNQLARPAIGLIPVPADGSPIPYPADPTGATFLNPITAPIYNDVVGNSERRKFDDFMVQFQHRFGDVDFISTARTISPPTSTRTTSNTTPRGIRNSSSRVARGGPTGSRARATRPSMRSRPARRISTRTESTRCSNTSASSVRMRAARACTARPASSSPRRAFPSICSGCRGTRPCMMMGASGRSACSPT